MAGRRPKPLELHRLGGNARKLSKAELNGVDQPDPEKGEPDMPRGLSRSARREWYRIVPLLKAIGVLSVIDGLALAAYCDAHGMVEAASKEITEHGLTFVTHYQDRDGNIVEGGIKANPAVAIKIAALKLMKTFLIEFGLTPASRRNLKIDKKSISDPMESFMRRAPKQQETRPLLIPIAPPTTLEEEKL